MNNEGDREQPLEGERAHAGGTSGSAARPTHIYINHLLEGQERDVEAYLFPLAGEDVQRAVEEVMPRVERGENRVPGSPRNIEWRHRSYIVFVLKSADDRLEGIDFKLNGTGGNHTFINEQALADFGTYTGVYYLNDRRNQQGNPLGQNEREKYRWKSHHRHRSGPDSPRSHENSGTNVGP